MTTAFEDDLERLRELQTEINQINGITDDINFSTIGAIVISIEGDTRYDNYGCNIKLGKVKLAGYYDSGQPLTEVEYFKEGHVCSCIWELRHLISLTR